MLKLITYSLLISLVLLSNCTKDIKLHIIYEGKNGDPDDFTSLGLQADEEGIMLDSIYVFDTNKNPVFRWVNDQPHDTLKSSIYFKAPSKMILGRSYLFNIYTNKGISKFTEKAIITEIPFE
jgi:hypothetical protein